MIVFNREQLISEIKKTEGVLQRLPYWKVSEVMKNELKLEKLKKISGQFN